MVKFIKKSWLKSSINGTVYKGVGLYWICITVSRQNDQLFYRVFAAETKTWRAIEGCIYGYFLPLNLSKFCHGIPFFWWINFQTRQNFIIWKVVSFVPSRILSKPWSGSIKRNIVTKEFLTQSKCLERYCFSFCSKKMGLFFGSIFCCGLGVMSLEKTPQAKIGCRRGPPTLFWDKHRLVSVK